MGDEKQEKSKKEYETLKLKRSGLETVRDIFAVIRDLLLILVLLGLIVLILIGITLLMNAGQIFNSIQSGGLGSLLGGASPLSALGSLSGGNLGNVIPVTETQTKTVKGTAEICGLMAETKNSYESGDFQSAQQKLTQLKSIFKKKGWTEQTQLVDKIIQATSKSDIANLFSYSVQLENSVDCTQTQ